MSLIEELRSRPDLGPDFDKHFRPTGEKLTVFQRVQEELAHGELGRKVDEAIRKQYMNQAWFEGGGSAECGMVVYGRIF